jgi:hypothetical protein
MCSHILTICITIILSSIFTFNFKTDPVVATTASSVSLEAIDSHELPSLKILTPITGSLLWNNLVMQLELILSNSSTTIRNFEVCLHVYASSQQNVRQCFPVNFSGDVVSGIPLTTEVTLEIEDAGSIIVKAFISGCTDNTQHCASTVQVNTCRIKQFGQVEGGAKCKSSWNLKNAVPLNQQHTQTSQLNQRSLCEHRDLTHQCMFPSHTMCFHAKKHHWLVKANSLERKTYNSYVQDPSSFLDVFLGPYRRSQESGISLKLQTKNQSFVNIFGNFSLVVPYMRHVFFHAVADDAFQTYATFRDRKSRTNNVTLLILATKRQKYDFLLQSVVGKSNVQYLGELLSDEKQHCFENIYTGILKRNFKYNILPNELYERHRFDVWHTSTLSGFRSHMLAAAKVLDGDKPNANSNRERIPYITMLVHRARSEAQSEPGKFITTQIRQIINQDELWLTVTNIVQENSKLCVDPDGKNIKMHHETQLSRIAMQVVLEDLSFKEQLELLSSTEIFIHLHGSAGVMSFFLPPGAIFVELRPFKFTWTTWALELANSNQLKTIQWINNKKKDSVFAQYPYTKYFDETTLKYFENMNPTLLCDEKELKREIGMNHLQTWCQQYYRDQHTVVDVNLIGEKLKDAMKSSLFCVSKKK